MLVVIDDNHDTLELMKYKLSTAGFEVEIFDSGTPALDFLKRDGIDVDAIILDLSLPTLDGLTIAEQIRLNEQTFAKPPAPMAFYTAYSQTAGGATERVAERCGVDFIWHKPADTPDIEIKIKHWLDAKKSERMTRSLNHAI